ncbi:hypothetical protein [Actinacidiphila acididurans]|uniref:Uncharacterized protein n=1 Tax=Actinacidiphila acididurans TaxID=2784346 RepID=A0ABS2TQG9_9ACTN|nr:hypothetical protein [Actinacidiphila acididurans]MBM9504515.1 hypothetical protein [Actinacidiphila acididurans]
MRAYLVRLAEQTAVTAGAAFVGALAASGADWSTAALAAAGGAALRAAYGAAVRFIGTPDQPNVT